MSYFGLVAWCCALLMLLGPPLLIIGMVVGAVRHEVSRARLGRDVVVADEVNGWLVALEPLLLDEARR